MALENKEAIVRAEHKEAIVRAGDIEVVVTARCVVPRSIMMSSICECVIHRQRSSQKLLKPT